MSGPTATMIVMVNLLVPFDPDNDFRFAVPLVPTLLR
jgi:hypothetical protein